MSNPNSDARMWYLIAALFFISFLCQVGVLIIRVTSSDEKPDVAISISDQENRDAFSGWCKITGNKDNLTYDEWVSLKNVKLLNKHSK